MLNKQKRQGVTVTELLNQCTGIMRVDEENNYLGYYTRKQLQDEMIAQGEDPKLVDLYVFSLKECKESHPTIEDIVKLQEQEGK